MNEKEQNFLGVLGLLVSLAIFIIIIFSTIDFNGMKVKAVGDKMMSYLSENQYEKFYDNLSSDNLSTLDKFTEYEKSINQMLGDIKKYSYLGAYKNKSVNNENNISMEYDARFSKFPDEAIKVTLIFNYNKNKWQVSQYNIAPENTDNNSEMISNINHINSSLRDESREIDDVKGILSEIIQDYDNKNYKNIYKILSDELKEKGKEYEFINYLESQYNKYGQLSNAKIKGYEINKDKSEYKFNYCLDDDKNNKKTYITIWIKMKDKPFLSGIKFSENEW